MAYADDDDDKKHVWARAVCTAETPKAIRVSLMSVMPLRAIYIPKSVVHDDSEVWKPGQDGKLIVKHWWAVKEGHAEAEED